MRFCVSGKTLLARAVARQTNATFLRVVGSELIQKYLGDGPKLVRELFKVAREHAPSIVFIDEIDAVGTKRSERSSTGENAGHVRTNDFKKEETCVSLSADTTPHRAASAKFKELC